MTSEGRLTSPDPTSPTTRVGATIAVLSFIVVLMFESEAVSASLGLLLSIVVILIGIGWAARGRDRPRRLSALYLWLAFIVSIYHLDVVSSALAGWIGWQAIEVLRPIAVAALLGVCAALWVLGAWSGDQGTSGSHANLVRLAAGLFIVGAVVFWVGARTFPGLALERIQANPERHLWTSVNFVLATILTIGGLALLTLALREAGDRVLSALGLLIFTFGSVFWVLHLAIRMTVMVQAAQEWRPDSAPPEWFEPWRAWAALLFGLYSVLAYAGLAAYGVALLTIAWRPRWIGWTCVLAGPFAAVLGGLPLFIHVPLWLIGILALTTSPYARPAKTA